MASLLEDQAAGLRKLFAGAHGPTRIAFAGREADGRGALMAGVARGLAAAGKEVLLIDGASGAASAAAALGLRPRFDLLQAVSRDVPAGRVLLGAGHGIRLLPAARALREYPRLAAAERRALDEWLRRQQGQADFVLGEARAGEAADPCPLLPQPQRLVVAVTPESQSITAAYTQMKRLAPPRGGARFLLVILRADAGEADTVFGNHPEPLPKDVFLHRLERIVERVSLSREVRRRQNGQEILERVLRDKLARNDRFHRAARPPITPAARRSGVVLIGIGRRVVQRREVGAVLLERTPFDLGAIRLGQVRSKREWLVMVRHQRHDGFDAIRGHAGRGRIA